MKNKIGIIVASALLAVSSMVSAGPIIIDGGDFTDHGSYFGGTNNKGWKYIEKSFDSLLSSETRGGAITVDIVSLGSAESLAISSNAGGAVHWAASALGVTHAHYDGAAGINQFFADLAAGTVNPRVIHTAGTGAANNLNFSEGAALNSNATAINDFVASGGGLLGSGSGSTGLGWLNALLPAITFNGGCNSNGASLTAAGNSAFPGLLDSDIDSSAGPCHGTFSNVGGGLDILGLDGNGRALIIGNNNQGGSITDPGVTGVPEPLSLVLMAIGLFAVAGVARKRA